MTTAYEATQPAAVSRIPRAELFSEASSNRVPLAASKTVLAGALSNQPWNDYVFGQGINALTGQLSDIAVEPFNIGSYPSYNSHTAYTSISSESEYQSTFSAEVEGSYNTSQLKVSAAAKFLQDISYSDSSMTIVASVDILSNGYGTPNEPYALSPEAQELLDKSPSEFSSKYGHYFVSTAIAGARFIATYRCNASSSESLTEFKASIEAGTDMLSAKGATEFSQKASAKNVAVSCDIFMEGTNTTPPHFGNSIDAIPKALDWFLESGANGPAHLSFVARRAMLTNYSQLSAKVSNSLDVDPRIFARIQRLQFLITQVKTLLETLPDYYGRMKAPGGGTCEEVAIELTARFEASQAELPNTPEIIEAMVTTASQVIDVLQPQVALFSFYESLISTDHHESAQGQSTQMFGYRTNPGGVPIKVQSASQNYEAWWKVGHQQHTFNWPWAPYDEHQIIVGWEMQDIWHNGSTWYTKPMIGKSQGSVFVDSAYDHGIDWTFCVYFVNKSEFPWLG